MRWWARCLWLSSASPDRPWPTLTTPWPSLPNPIPPAHSARPSPALAQSARPGYLSPAAHNVHALRRLPHGKNRLAWRRSQHAVASTPGAMGACNVRRSSDQPSWHGRRHPAATPSGPRSISNTSARKARDSRRLCEPWPFNGSACSLGVGTIARRTMRRSLSRRLPAVAHHGSTTWRRSADKREKS
jgi:hypothetical protein